MKALVGAFNQEKALVGAFSVIVQRVVEPMDRFTALAQPPLHRSPRPATAPTSRPRPGHHHQPASTPLTGVLFIKYFTDMRTFQQVPHLDSRVFDSHEYFSLNQE